MVAPFNQPDLNYPVIFAELSDHPTLCTNEKRCYPHPWSDAQLKDCLTGDYRCFLLKKQQVIIGHMIIQQVLDEIHLHNVCVLPAYQQQGFGIAWLKFLNDYALQNNACSIFLEVRASNTTALSLYNKMGYQQIGLRKKYYQVKGGRENCLVMKVLVEKTMFEY